MAFERFFAKWPDAVDYLEMAVAANGEHVIHAMRDPDLTIPDGASLRWLPNIMPRSASRKLHEMDPDGSIRTLMARFAKLAPIVQPSGEHWQRGCPTITLGRTKASVVTGFSHGKIAIYVEGRDKNPALHLPYWTTETAVWPHPISATHSDLLMAGGPVPWILDQLVADNSVKIQRRPEVVKTKGEGMTPSSVVLDNRSFIETDLEG